MKSWDMWDTLVAGRGTQPAGDQPDGSHFPVTMNVMQVQPDDVVVSDYYDAEKAARILKSVTGLNNKLIVTPQDKANGKIWPGLKASGVTHHTGDNKHSDFLMPQQFGITATHYQLSAPVQAEKVLYGINSSLGLMAREARLTIQVYEQYMRFQELQIAVNFPFLLLATIFLERCMTVNNREMALMSSRDACLWVTLAQEIFRRRGKGLEAQYFYSGRLPRVFPSEAYLKYVNSWLTKHRSLIVDLNGTGWSLKRLVAQTESPSTPIVVLSHVKVAGQEQVQEKMAPSRGDFINFVEGNPVGFEPANYARHPMISDVDDSGSPVFANPTGFPWGTFPVITVMHDAFAHMLEVSKNYDINGLFCIDSGTLKSSAQMILNAYAEWDKDLGWNHTLFAAEHDYIFRELQRRKK
jgi:hypothetical protein